MRGLEWGWEWEGPPGMGCEGLGMTIRCDMSGMGVGGVSGKGLGWVCEGSGMCERNGVGGVRVVWHSQTLYLAAMLGKGLGTCPYQTCSAASYEVAAN